MENLSGRTAIVTGAAQGLGRAIAERFLSLGCAVIGGDRLGEKLAAAAAELGCNGQAGFFPVAGDLRSAATPNALVDRAIAETGRLDILVNCAGGSGDVGVQNIDELTDDLWDQVIESNLRATFQCCRAAVPHMRTARWGRILNFSSSLARGMRGPIGTVGARLAYCAAKGGIEALSRQLALDVADDGITVNVIEPGFVLTEPGARVRERFEALSTDEQQAILAGRDPTDLPQPADVARVAAFLSSNEAGHLNGLLVPVGA